MCRFPSAPAALFAAALFAVTLFASSASAAGPRVRVGFHGGYRIGGSLDQVRYSVAERPADLEVNEGFSFGIEAGYAVGDHVNLTARFDRQSTDLQLESGPSGLVGFPVTADHVHGGVRFRFPGRSITPVLSFSLGSAFLRPTGDRETLRRFSWAAGTGVERAVSSRVRVRAETRLLAVFLDSAEAAFCGPGSDCYSYSLTTWLWQGEASLGLVVGF